MKKNVLFLCTGNSARSQMAEAIVNYFHGDGWQAFSAGTRPAGFVYPMAIRVLAEIGIAPAGRSKSVEEFAGREFDLVITVCDSAAEECPLWLGQGKRMHLSFPDPVQAEGREEDRLAAFRAVRDDILRRVPPLLEK